MNMTLLGYIYMIISLIFAPLFENADAPRPVPATLPRPVLVTTYHQMGWGDSVQIGYVDEDGGMWFVEGHDKDLKWPYEPTEQLAWLENNAQDFVSLGALNHEDLFALDSLVQCVEAQDGEIMPAANDAGTEISYSVRYSKDGPEVVTLGLSGDSMFENTDATAQALYLFLRTNFPGVYSYFGHQSMGPAGFQTVPLMEFCGYADVDLANATVTQNDIDCEAGTEPVTLSSDEAKDVLDKILAARVTGKRSCIVTTGGSTVYSFIDKDGNQLASFEFYDGLLVMPDGMYSIGE